MSTPQLHQNKSFENVCQDLLEKVTREGNISTAGKTLLTYDYKDSFIARMGEILSSKSLSDRLAQSIEILIESLSKMLTNMTNEYAELEKVLQKNENDYRKHIRVEQQLKLYSEAQQQKLDDLEQSKVALVEKSNVSVQAMKKENSELSEKIRKLKFGLDTATTRIKALEASEQENALKLASFVVLQEKLKYNRITRKKKYLRKAVFSRVISPPQTISPKRKKQQPPALMSLTSGTPSPLKMHPIRKTYTPQIPNNSQNNHPNMLSSQKHSDLLKVKLEFKDVGFPIHQQQQPQSSSQQQQYHSMMPSNFKDLQNILTYPDSQRRLNNASGPHIQKPKEAFLTHQRTRSRNSEVNRTQSSQIPSTSTSINTSHLNQVSGSSSIGATINPFSIPYSNISKELASYSNTTQMTLNSQHKRIRSIGGQNKLRGSMPKQAILDTMNQETLTTQPQQISQEYSDYLNQQDLPFRASKENFSSNPQIQTNVSLLINRPHPSSSLSQRN